MSTQPIATPKYKTRCQFCGREFQSEPFVPIIGNGADPRRLKMGQVLGSHVMSEHGPQLQALMMAACFHFEDPILLEELNGARWLAHQMTAKNYIPDEAMEHQLAEQGFDAEQIKYVIGLRDFFTETGLYSPTAKQTAPQSTLVS